MILVFYIWLACGLVCAAILLPAIARDKEDPTGREMRESPHFGTTVFLLILAFGPLGLALVLWELVSDTVQALYLLWLKHVGVITIRIERKPLKVLIVQTLYVPPPK